MRRSWAIASVLAGVGFVSSGLAAALLDLGGPEASETLGAMALLLGLFFLAEGALSLRRRSALRALGREARPK
jgi:hypothetical protein